MHVLLIHLGLLISVVGCIMFYGLQHILPPTFLLALLVRATGLLTAGFS